MKKYSEFFYKYRFIIYWVLFVSLAIIFSESILDFFDAHLLSYFEKVADNSIGVQVFVLVSIACVYMLCFRSFSCHREIVNSRRCLIVILLIFDIVLECHNRYDFYGLDRLNISYVLSGLLLSFMCELGIIIFTRIKKKNGKPKSEVHPFCIETPILNDSYDRRRYVKLLLDKLCSSHELNKGAFTILLNERFGQGKSSFRLMLQDMICDDKQYEGVSYMEFKPWLYASEEAVVTNFYKSLLTHFHEDMHSDLFLMLKVYMQTLLAETPSYLDGFLGKNEIGAEQIYSEIKTRMENENLLVISIDDVDRLDYEELIAVMKLVRNSADFPNIVYLILADKDVLIHTLEKGNIVDPSEFLKKFFNFELTFPSKSISVTKSLMESVNSELINNYDIQLDEKRLPDERMLDAIFKNERDVIRFKNLLYFNLDSLKMNNVLSDIDPNDLVILSLLQYYDSRIYKIFRDSYYEVLDVDVNGRMCINHQYLEYFRLLNNFSNTKLELMKQTNSGTEKHKDLTVDQVFDCIDLEPGEIVGDLVCRLWGKQMSRKEENSIIYIYNFYKYFAGKYSANEMSNNLAVQIVNKPLEEFSQWTLNYLENNSGVEFIHKLFWYVNHKKFNIIFMMKRILCFFEHFIRNDRMFKELYFDRYYFKTLCCSMFLSQNGGKETTLEEIEDFFSSDSHYVELSLVLNEMSLMVSHNISTIYNFNIAEMKSSLIKRFLTHEMQSDVIPLDVLETMRIISTLSEPTWESEFCAFVHEHKLAEQLTYRLIEPIGQNRYRWNNSVRNCFRSQEEGYYSWYKNMIRLCISNNVLESLQKTREDGIFLESSRNDIFLANAIQWHLKNDKN